MLSFKIFKNEYGRHIKIAIGKHNIDIKLYRSYKTEWTLGVRNNTPDGKRLIFLDYDNTLIDWLEDEIRYLQKKYELSNFYVFESSQKPNSYHAICLDKLNFHKFVRIINDTSCDEYYKTMPLKNDYRTWVLRLLRKANSERPRLRKIIFNDSFRIKSHAHMKLLKLHYGIADEDFPSGLYDKNDKIYVVSYGTLNYIGVEDTKNI